MLDITKFFSVLIASGNGARCNDLRALLRQELWQLDPVTGKYRVIISKHGKYSRPEDHRRLGKYIAKKITPLFSDVNDYYFSVDLPKERKVK